MSKVILKFDDADKMQRWLGYWSDGGGEDGIYDGWSENEPDDYPKITTTTEE